MVKIGPSLFYIENDGRACRKMWNEMKSYDHETSVFTTGPEDNRIIWMVGEKAKLLRLNSVFLDDPEVTEKWNEAWNLLEDGKI